METSTPGLAKVLTMVLFALSCVGLLLFLWLSFGGQVPFNPRGYRIQVAFRDAQQLATQADVRIAGVSVGKVIDKELDPNGNRTLATIQLNNKYAPIHKDATAILRTKTLLGETYVELRPGSRNSPALADNGVLARGQVQPAVQLDTIFNALDPTTRHAFQVWQQQLAVGVRGNDINLNDVFGNLPTFAADATDILAVLDTEHGAVVNLVRNGGTVFGSLSQNQSALRNLITSSDTVFKTTAANQAALADTIHVFPTFLDQSRMTMAQLQSFSFNSDQACCVAGQNAPLLKELIPVAQNLGPTLHAVQLLLPAVEEAVRQPQPAGHGLEDGPSRHRGVPEGPGLHAPAGTELPGEPGHADIAARARDVPRAAQPDPQLARAAPAADLGLHLQRRDVPERHRDHRWGATA